MSRPLFVAPKRNTVKVASLGPQFVKSRKVAPAANQLLHVAAGLIRPGHVQQLVPSMALGPVATMLTMGGRLVGGGTGDRMLTSTGMEMANAQPLSVALAVGAILVPGGGLVQVS